jgi:hypothetical protein
MAYTWKAGTFGKATVESTDLSLTSWTYSEGGDDADTTHSGGAGIKQTTVVTKQYNGTCEGIWDDDLQPTDDPPNVRRGTTATLKLYLDATTFFSIPVVILTFEATSSVTDVIRFSFTWTATAAPTMPV